MNKDGLLIDLLKRSIHQEMRIYPSYRGGQALFNILSEVCPDFSEQIRGTELDPFYQDILVEGCLNAFREFLKKQ